MDYKCLWVEDKILRKNVEKVLKGTNKRKAKCEMSAFIDTYKRISKGENISYWDIQWQATKYLNNQISIIPAKNLITNIGLGVFSTHAKKNKIPKQLYTKDGEIHFCYNERYEMEYPFESPKYMIRNTAYDELVDNALYPKFVRKCVEKFKRIIGR